MFKNLRYFTSEGVPLSLGNMISENSEGMHYVQIHDAAEDAQDANDFLKRVNKLCLNEEFELDRVTPWKVRLKGVDCFGNIHYLEATPEKQIPEPTEEAKSKWIPVSKHLPEVGEDVWLKFGKSMSVGWFYKESEWYVCIGYGEYTEAAYAPTEWMPIPEEFKVEGREEEDDE